MAEGKRVGDLEVNQDLKHQRLEWKVERAGWIVMALFILAALAGLLGRGPLSDSVAGERGSRLWAEYQRFARYQAPAIIRVHLTPGDSPEGKVRLRLNRDFIERIELRLVDPEPEIVAADAGGMVYTFLLAAGQPTTVTYHLEANAFGSLPVSLAVEGGDALSFRQFIYP